ncbi:Rtc1p [Lachancea thermotolerans CBS 6340]|uniref:Restriction of telomere capping protein 1 n=1 Tax=Lachancea thermotolerans (strain ATCC 56472 / CBS 6340 / NRRL Y-8284) TaxID=559295 RepID=RTC1_LACTC|nr:KLTH0F19338p [Lachancea thermotolerans CBS 6340]C5DJV1.1 RecName: Full=Restriction of telomere capping protein 1 [Lachancea thermotolerans CBS 6340]CAR24590.1 KLTH0F19338p [Lachancea thermotolerans CBS 6340]
MSRSQSPSLNDGLSTSNSRHSSSHSRFSLHKAFPQLSGNASFNGTSPKTKLPSRFSGGSNPPYMDSLKEQESSSSSSRSNFRRANYVNPGRIRSSGLKYSLQAPKELSSIDKINDPASRSIVISGKNHLGLYRFREDYGKLELTLDLFNIDQKAASLRTTTRKTSTISDVKAGFHNYKNYVAICGTSTSVSIYDINRANLVDGPASMVLSKHTRSINSVDFNMAQTSLLISGSQDGCIKVWDLRSSQGRKNKSDLTINSGSDSVRDVKWMPTYDFPNNDDVVAGPSNRSHRFASIHDSGLLLTYDLRQPSQAEKRINAHSGPGLCLSWHPTLDYIMTGGRDGKCCLWNMGSKPLNPASFQNIHHNSSFSTSAASSFTQGFSANSVTNFINSPEAVVNTAHPLTKLKFRPSAIPEVFDSVIALSSLGENSDVSLYSLSRSYIPKNVLTTNSPSCGFVWWNENLIFNIDKQNMVTGWDLGKEPTVLDNLPKNKIAWRDIEGDGLVFLAQDKGGYESGGPDGMSVSTETRNFSQSRLSTTTMSNLFPSHTMRQNSSVSSFPALNTHSNSGANLGDRPSLPRTVTSYSKGAYTQTYGSYNTHSSHHNSAASASASSIATELGSEHVLSPRMISLDLPHILNSIRSAKIENYAKKPSRPGSAAFKDSPVEVFKFLSRELKFSYMHDRNFNKPENLTDQDDLAQSVDDNDLKSHLITRFGFSENNTWTKFIKKSNSPEKDAAVENGTKVNEASIEKVTNSPNDTGSDELSSISKLSTEPKKSDLAERNITAIRQRVKHFIELVSMCDHNAEIYLYIDDLSNFKIWMMMRDSLLWELKQITDSLETDGGSLLSESLLVNPDVTRHSNGARKQSMASDYSSFSTSEVGSTTGVQALPEFRGPHSLSTPPRATTSFGAKEPSSLKKRESTIDENLSETEIEAKGLPKEDIKNLRNQISKHQIGDEVAIEDEEEDKFEEKSSAGTDASNKNIPIIPSERKVSFVDQFINSMRSPKTLHGDFETDGSRMANSASTKRSSQPSFSSSLAGLITRRLSDQSPKTKPKDLIYSKSSGSIAKNSSDLFDFQNVEGNNSPRVLTQKSKISMLLKGLKKSETAPPWDASRLIKKIFEQSVATGNVLLTISIILLFQTTFKVTSTTVVKNALSEFINILHKYELFEIAANLLKFCPWDDILEAGNGQCTVRIYCERCKKLLVNESSKEKFTEEWKRTGRQEVMKRFGYWYCDNCSKRNTLCVLCEQPLKKLTFCVLNCGHEGHPECFKKWFMNEEMSECPSGCSGFLL